MRLRSAFVIFIFLGSTSHGSTVLGCEGKEYRWFDDLVGRWEEYTVSEEGREHLGTLTTERVAGGCGIRHSFLSPDGTFSYEALGSLAPDGAWREHYAMSDGRTATYEWTRDGERLILTRVSGGEARRKRLVIFDHGADSYFVADEESTDGGQTWRRRELVHTVRRSSETE